MQKVVISGGTGLIGSRLTAMLAKEKFQVFHLTRSPKASNHIFWDPAVGKIDAEKLVGTQVLIHLAGENIGAKRWSEAQKKLLFNSRLTSTKLLADTFVTHQIQPACIVAASGAGIYGNDQGEHYFTEKDPNGQGFAAELAAAWEKGTNELAPLTSHFFRFRIGVVLSSQGGALAKMLPVFQSGLGAPLGSGKQFLSWIHIDDLCRLMGAAMETSISPGVYNAVSPVPVTNYDFSAILAKALGRWLLPIPVPAFVLRLMFGEMANLVLGGARVSPEKLQQAGFTFLHTDLEEALKDLLTRKI